MEYEIRPVNKLQLGFKELWEYRELIYFFVWRDIKVKYKQTVLGILWSLLQPVLLMVVFTLFFGHALGVKTENDIPYPIFVYSGLLFWNIFSSGLSDAANSMVANANIIKKIYFPRIIIPLSAIITAVFDFIIAFAMYTALLVYFRHSVSIDIFIFLPAGILITVVATLGLGCFLSALNVKYRDFRYIVPFLIQIILFLTPVIYPVSIIKYKWIQMFLTLNPMAGAIELLRSSVTHLPVNFNIVIPGAIVALLLFLFGLFYFRKTEYYFADLA